MSDCSGIKTYIKPEKIGISKYIDLSEKTDDERFEEFAKTVEFAIDSLAREKYSVQIFADILHVACNKISDIYPRISCDDPVVTSDYILPVVTKKEAYETFVRTVERCNSSYRNDTNDKSRFYNGVMVACEVLDEALSPSKKLSIKR